MSAEGFLTTTTNKKVTHRPLYLSIFFLFDFLISCVSIFASIIIVLLLFFFQFFCGVGPITNDYLNATLSAVVSTLSSSHEHRNGRLIGSQNWLSVLIGSQAQAKAAGLKVEYVNMLGCPSDGKAGFTCDGCATHPGITGHRKMFEMSYHVIKSTMGW